MSDKLYQKKTGMGILPHLPDETMVPGRMRISTAGSREASKYVYERNGSVLDYRNAFSIGGGDIGASVHGFPDNYTFDIGKNDIWWDDFDSDPPCYYPGGIGELRERILAGDEELKNDIFRASANRKNQPNQTSAARLTLHLCRGADYGNVREKFDLRTGTLTTSFYCGDQNGIINSQNDGGWQMAELYDNYFSVMSFFSHADDILYIRCNAPVRAGHWGKMSLELTKNPMEVSQNSGQHTPEEIRRLEKEIDEYYSPVPFADGDFFGFDMRLRSGIDPETSPDVHYTVMMCAKNPGFHACCAGTRLIAEGRPEGAEVEFILTVVSTYDAADTRKAAKERLTKALDHQLWVIEENKDKWTDQIWNRSWIRIGDDKKYAEKWYTELYEAISCRKPGKFAPAYLAPWYPTSYASWGYHILTFEQTRNNFGLISSNHAELLEPWFHTLIRAEKKLKKFTKDFYGMNGTAYPHAISGIGTVIASTVTLNGTEMNLQTTGESVKYCWDYYDATGDIDFLREIGYPLLREAAIFYSEYLLTADDGEKYIFPSRVWEYVNCPGMSDEFFTNTTIDLALFRFTIEKAMQSAEILGTDSELVTRWKDDLAHLRKDYPTWEDGYWKTAENSKRVLYQAPQALSDTAPIAYTGEIDKWHSSYEGGSEAAMKTVDRHIPAKTRPWDGTFGPIARLRMGDREYGDFLLETYAKDAEKLRFVGNEFRRECFSTDTGSACTTEVIDEILLQSQGGVIRVFPAYTGRLGDASFCSLRARGAFLVASEMRDREVSYVIVRSLAGNDCTFANPFGDRVRVRDLETGEEKDITVNGENITFGTQKGYEYVIENREKPLESFPLR